MSEQDWAATDPRSSLRADCAQCVGLCCVAPAFVASADFAIDKPAGRACPNLLVDSRCGIHTTLRERGFPGCVVFDCFGAGQQVTQVTFGGQDWRDAPSVATAMFDSFTVMRQLHEFRWYLAEARSLDLTEAMIAEIDELATAFEGIAASSPDRLAAVDVNALGAQVSRVLTRVSAEIRSRYSRSENFHGADLVGRQFRGADLRGANLRGSYLLGADLRHADLSHADLLGADLRGADLRGARLGSALFVTQPQVEASRGDATTTVPAALVRPRHWT